LIPGRRKEIALNTKTIRLGDWKYITRMKYWAEMARTSEEHQPIPDFPPYIYGENENQHVPRLLKRKIDPVPQSCEIEESVHLCCQCAASRL